MEREGSPPATWLAAGITLVVLAGVWAWWAAKEGGYFGSVLYPGLILLCVGFLLVSSRASSAAPFTIGTAGRVALWALIGLASWSALSALWSATPDVALADAQRIAAYALAFGLGAWLMGLAGKRPQLALVPLAVAGLFAGGVAVGGLLTSDDFNGLIDSGTLQYPLGYRNANAAFFLIALWPAVTLAASREVDWRLRGTALATATLCLEIAMLSQSRGSLLGAAAALVVLLIASKERARMTGWLVLAALPALVVIPALTDLFQTAELDIPAGTDELRAAGKAALGGALAALVVGTAAAWIGRRVDPSPERAKRGNRAVAAGAIGLAVAGALAFTVATGDPAGWVGDRVDEFLTQRTPDEAGQSSRFGINAGSERDDLWRVAVETAGDDPVTGTGGGGYGYEYLLRRSEDGIESVRDAHSVELEVLSELGIVGLVLFCVTIGAAAWGAWGGRRPGPASASVAACALAAAAYWLTHSSLDWFWTYPGVTAPVFALLGSACARPGAERATSPGNAGRRGLAAAVAILALSAIPPYLSERYVDAAYAGFRSDPDRAHEFLERARDLNPLSIEPLLAQGGIARAEGDRERAIAAFEEAASERPEEFATHYFLALLYRGADPERARREYRLTRALNPLGAIVDDLRERLFDPVSER